MYTIFSCSKDHASVYLDGMVVYHGSHQGCLQYIALFLDS